MWKTFAVQESKNLHMIYKYYDNIFRKLEPNHEKYIFVFLYMQHKIHFPNLA